MKLSKKNSFFPKPLNVFHWNIISSFMHMWPKKGKLFRHRLVTIDELLDLGRKLLQKNKSQGALVHGDRQFSFDDTPVAFLKMSQTPAILCFKMPNIPCFNPYIGYCNESEAGDEEIDEKAEQFIARFREEMKRQRHHTTEIKSTVNESDELS